MEDRIITTFDGTPAKRSDCRNIKGAFYKKNSQCFLIGSTWYRINSGSIVLNHTTKKWVLKTDPDLVRGIIGYDHYEDEVIVGYFTKDIFENVNISINNTTYPCISAAILPESKFFEEIYTNTYKLLREFSPKTSNRIPNITFGNHDYPFSLQYNMRHADTSVISRIEDKFIETLSKRLRSNNIPAISEFSEYLDKYTFGLEFETSRGRIPTSKLGESGLVPLRDGSITGIEYASIPQSGKSGLVALKMMVENLKKYTTISSNDSLHLHIGGFGVPKKDYKEFVARLFAICCVIEPEIYNMFPSLYIKTSSFKGRGKDYNKPLPRNIVNQDLLTTFNNLALYLSSGKSFSGLGSNHPSDREDNHKWQIEERYFWANFIPMLYGKTTTVEFRIHLPTQNYDKIVNWLYICAAIISYAKKPFELNESVKKLTLKSILSAVYPYRLSAQLLDYIEFRKKISYENDPKGEIEIANDHMTSF